MEHSSIRAIPIKEIPMDWQSLGSQRCVWVPNACVRRFSWSVDWNFSSVKKRRIQWLQQRAYFRAFQYLERSRTLSYSSERERGRLEDWATCQIWRFSLGYWNIKSKVTTCLLEWWLLQHPSKRHQTRQRWNHELWWFSWSLDRNLGSIQVHSFWRNYPLPRRSRPITSLHKQLR